jgi:putative inorganic carbon (hco3(-)) transporter
MTERLLDGRGIVFPALALSLPLAYATAKAPLLALAGVASVILLILVLVWAEAVLLLLVAALPWEGLLQYPTETVSAVKILGLLLVVAWILRALAGRELLRLPGTLAAVIVFGMLLGVSFVFSPDPAAGIGKVLRYVLFIAFFFLVIQLVRDSAGVRRVLRVLALSATGAALWALVSYLNGSLERAGGPIEDPNDFAFLIVAVLPIVGLLFVEERDRRGIWATSFAILIAAALATLSRGALVGLAALALWALLTGKVSVGGVLTGAAALVGVVLVALTFWSPLVNESVTRKGKIAEQNTASRLAFWDAAMEMTYDRPLVGVGPGRFGDETANYLGNRPSTLQRPAAHNSYLEIMAESGFPALVAFLVYLGGSWVLLARGRRQAVATGDQAGVRLATALQASFVASAVSAMFLSQQLALPFWLLGALATALAVAGTATRKERPVHAGLRVTRAPA